MQDKDMTELFYPLKLAFNMRVLWYSVIIWLFGFLVTEIVIVPWFYPVLALVIVTATVFYFKIIDPLKVSRGRRGRNYADKLFAFGLAAAMDWFLIITILSLVEVAAFYYYNFAFYLSDFRNWFLYALILLVPVVYSLILESIRSTRPRKKSRLLF